MDLELLAQHAEGVICLTGCLASRTSQRIVDGRLPAARAHLDELIQVFGPEDVYLEVQRNGIAEQEQVNEAMKRFAAEIGRPLVGDRGRPLPAQGGLQPPRGAAVRADEVDARAAEDVASTPTSSI